jgi:hypothetical protein
MALFRYDLDVTLNAPTYQAMAGVNVYVCSQPSNANQANPNSTPIPPAPLAALFSDVIGTPLTNPIETDENGHAFFYANPQLVDIVVNDPQGRLVSTLVYLDQSIGIAGGLGGLNFQTNGVANLNQGLLNISAGAGISAVNTVGGTVVITNTGAIFTAQNANQIFSGPASGPAALPGFRFLVPADVPGATGVARGALILANDLGGTYSAPTVVATSLIAPLPVGQGGTGATTGAPALINLIGNSPSTGQVLTWNGSAWVPGTGGTFAVTSINSLTGAVTIEGANGITVSQTGSPPDSITISAAPGTITGAIAAGQVAFGGAAANTIAGSTQFTFVPGTGTVTLIGSGVPANSSVAMTVDSNGDFAINPVVSSTSTGFLQFTAGNGGVLIWGTGGNARGIGGPNGVGLTKDVDIFPISGGKARLTTITGLSTFQPQDFEWDSTTGFVSIYSQQTWRGSSSGSANIGVAANAGTPNQINLPIATGSGGQALVTDGNNPQQTSWGNPIFTSGSAGAPSIAFIGAAGTGMYLESGVGSPPEYGIGFSVQGVNALSVYDNGVNIPSGSTYQIGGAQISSSNLSYSLITKTGSYLATSADAGKSFVFNISSGATLTLPSIAPAAGWWIDVIAVGARLTISANGLMIDGYSGPNSIGSVGSTRIWSDGSNYWNGNGGVSIGTTGHIPIYTSSCVVGADSLLTDLNGTYLAYSGTGGIKLSTGSQLVWNADTNIARSGVGVVSVGTGVTVNALGTINAAAYRVAGNQISAANLSNGTTGVGEIVLQGSPLLTGTVVINSGGSPAASNLLISNNSSAQAVGQLTVTEDGTALTAAFVNYGVNGNTNSPAILGLAARGTLSAPAAVQSGDLLLSLKAGGYNGSSMVTSSTGALRVYATETWAVGRNGTYLSFWTTPIGTNTIVEKMRLNNAGVLCVNALGPVGTEKLYVNGTINATQYNVSGSQIAASNLSNGTTGSGAIALASSPVFTGVVEIASGTSAAPSLSFSSSPTTGMYLESGVGSPSEYGIGFSVQGVNALFVLDDGINIPTGSTYQINGAQIGTIASGTQALGTATINSGSDTQFLNISAPGVLPTDNVMVDFNTNPLSLTGYAPSSTGILTIYKWCGTNVVNFVVVNNTGSSITPSAVTVNWRVVR